MREGWALRLCALCFIRPATPDSIEWADTLVAGTAVCSAHVSELLALQGVRAEPDAKEENPSMRAGI